MSKAFEEKFLKATEYMASKIGNKEPHGFFTHFIRKLKLDLSMTKGLAAVGFRKDGGVLFLNAAELESLKISELAAILCHEVLHVALYHLQAAEFKVRPKLSNVAMDLEVNQLVEKMGYPLPKRDQLITLDWCMREFKSVPEANKDFKHYYAWLFNRMDESQNFVDNHEDWGDSDDMAKERLFRELEESYEHTGGQGLDKGAAALLTAKIAARRVKSQSWYRKLRNHFLSQRFENVNISKSKLSRYGIAGKPVLFSQGSVYLVLDSSGSVSDKEFASFIEHAYQIATRAGLKVTLIQVDTEVNRVSSFKELREERKSGSVKRKGYGGTCLKPGIDLANSFKDCGRIVVLSDGFIDSSSFPEGKTAPLLWVFTHKSEKILPNMPGEVVHMET